MKHNNSQNIISAYFGKHFSERAKALFGHWLRKDEDAAHKERLLLELWEQSQAEATEETHTDWYRLQKRLYTIPARRPIPWTHTIMKYTAVAILMLLVASGTHILTKRTSKPIEMTEFLVPYGESQRVILPDGSEVWVDAGSMLVYPKDFSNLGTRSIYLTGKASFTVTKNKDKPFIVKTTYLDVTALGTVFTVESYPSDSSTIATLEEGSVQVDVKGSDNEPSVLTPEQQLVYSHTAHTVEIQMVDRALYKMERNGYLIFENASFDHLIASLERKFNVKIHYNSQKYASEYYNVKFSPKETIGDVMAILQQLVGIHYKINGNIVYIN